MRRDRLLWLGLLVWAAGGCSLGTAPAETLRLATTTTTRDSGLMDVLVPAFEERTKIRVEMIVVGSGQALGLGRRGDVDVLLTHSPEAEKEFVAGGHADERRPVMFNDFVLVGPGNDPAKLRGLTAIADAFARLERSAAPFVSRGDESGTHQKEKEIWRRAGIEPRGDWYLRAGTGMAEVLRMADEKGAYTLTDRGTFLTQPGFRGLALLAEGDPVLRNEYAVLVVNPAKHPHVKHEAARRFAAFLVSPGTRERIARYGVADYGQPLFFPAGEDK